MSNITIDLLVILNDNRPDGHLYYFRKKTKDGRKDINTTLISVLVKSIAPVFIAHR